MAKKVCYKCKHLEWIDTGSEYGDDCGYCCNKRNYRNEYEKSNHLGLLGYPSYLRKGKSCYDPKEH